MCNSTFLYINTKYLDFEKDIGLRELFTDNISPQKLIPKNTKSRSLEMFVKQYNPKYSIRISSKNFGFENNIKSVPLYAVHLI